MYALELRKKTDWPIKCYEYYRLVFDWEKYRVHNNVYAVIYYLDKIKYYPFSIAIVAIAAATAATTTTTTTTH